MKVRQNPLTKWEGFLQRMVEGPFARLFPSKLEPVQLARKLERTMEDNLLQSVDRRLAPNVYDIYLSMKDHQRLSAGQTILTKELQDHLVQFARTRHYTLRSVPVLRLHPENTRRVGEVRITAELADRQHMAGTEGSPMATQALTPEQMAQLRAQLPAGSSLPPSPLATNSRPDAPPMPNASAVSSSLLPPLSQAWLTIRLAQAGQQVYHIEKPIINIGRQLSNDIIVEDKRVSRYHAQIKFLPNGEFAIYDLGSTNGITINNVANQRQHILHSGDRFVVGNYDFYFERR